MLLVTVFGESVWRVGLVTVLNVRALVSAFTELKECGSVSAFGECARRLCWMSVFWIVCLVNVFGECVR